MVLSTSKEDISPNATAEEAKLIEERVAIKRRIERDPCAMAFVCQDSYLYAFGLARQSLKRQSRKEGVEVSTAGVRRTFQRDEIGLGSSVAAKLGFGKYKTSYEKK